MKLLKTSVKNVSSFSMNHRNSSEVAIGLVDYVLLKTRSSLTPAFLGRSRWILGGATPGEHPGGPERMKHAIGD